MGARFNRGDEAGADPGAVGAGREHGRQRTPVTDPACGQHRHVNNGQYRTQQGQERAMPANVSTSLHTLDHDDITTRVGGRLRFGDRPHLPAHQGTRVVREPYERWIRVGPEEVGNPHAARGNLDRVPG